MARSTNAFTNNDNGVIAFVSINNGDNTYACIVIIISGNNTNDTFINDNSVIIIPIIEKE